MLLFNLILLLFFSNQQDEYARVVTATLISSPDGYQLKDFLRYNQNEFVFDLHSSQAVSKIELDGPGCQDLKSISVGISNSTNPAHLKLTAKNISCSDIKNINNLGYARFFYVYITLKKLVLDPYNLLYVDDIKFFTVKLPMALIDPIVITRGFNSDDALYKVHGAQVGKMEVFIDDNYYNFEYMYFLPTEISMQLRHENSFFVVDRHMKPFYSVIRQTATFEFAPGVTLEAFNINKDIPVSGIKYYKHGYTGILKKQKVTPNVFFLPQKQVTIYRMKFVGVKYGEALTGFIDYTDDGVRKTLHVATTETSLVLKIRASKITYVGLKPQEIIIYYS